MNSIAASAHVHWAKDLISLIGLKGLSPPASRPYLVKSVTTVERAVPSPRQISQLIGVSIQLLQESMGSNSNSFLFFSKSVMPTARAAPIPQHSVLPFTAHGIWI